MKFSILLTALFSFGALADSCSSDAKKFCSGLEANRAQLSRCLNDYQNQLSPACAKETKEFRAEIVKKNPCFDDVGEFCSEFAGTDKVKYCLLKNENRLNATCSADFKKKKGNIVVGDVCAQDVATNCYAELNGPDAGVVRCLIKNKSKLTKFCQSTMDKKIAAMKEKNPCFDDTEKLCPTQLNVADIQECLEKKLSSVAPACKKVIENEKAKAKANPCYKDLIRHCKPRLKPQQQAECLTLNESNLSLECKSYRVKEQGNINKMVELCEQDRLKLCPKAPFQDGLVVKCLKENKAKVSKACANLL